MITFFNRKELLITFSMNEQARVRSILSANGIDYRVKTVGGRSRGGSSVANTDAAYQYYIYVRAQDWERARHLI